MENSLENLTQYILNEADAQARELLEEALERARAERSQAENNFDAMFSQQKAQLEEQNRQTVKNALRQHAEKLNKEKTRFALSLIDQLFEEAENELCKMPPDSFLKFYQNSISGLKLNGEYKAVLGQNTARKLSAGERKMLELKTDEYSVSVADKTIPNQGGFILEHSPIELSFLFGDLLGEIKQKESPVLLKQLMD